MSRVQLCTLNASIRLAAGIHVHIVWVVTADFPCDICSATVQCFLEGKHTIYATCPNHKYHQTYKPVFENDSPIPKYPMYCTHHEYCNGSPCKEQIL
jgi:hypothetical protein